MPGTPTYVVQTFERHGDRVIFGERLATTEMEAHGLAEDAAGMFYGAAIICVVRDQEGAFSNLTVVETFGRQPEGWAEALFDKLTGPTRRS